MYGVANYEYVPLNNDSCYQDNHPDYDDHEERYDNHWSNNTCKSGQEFGIFLILTHDYRGNLNTCAKVTLRGREFMDTYHRIISPRSP